MALSAFDSVMRADRGRQTRVQKVDQIPVWHRNVAAMESGWRDLRVIAKESG